MKKLRILRNAIFPCLLLCSGTGSTATGITSLDVTATVISKNICTFNTANSTLAFGALNPASTADATANTTVTIRCRGTSRIASFLITQDGGRYETTPGANRMRNTAVTTEFLPYTLTINPATALIPRRTNTPIAISGTITASNYQNAYVGNYRDTVILTLVP